MRKHVEESVATGVAAGRGRGGRFSAGRKRVRGEDLESVSRAVGITAARASHWRAQFLAAGQAGLKSRAPDARSSAAGQGRAAGRPSYCTRRWTSWRPAALWPGGGDAMSGAQSISTRRAYGVRGSAACGTAPAPVGAAAGDTVSCTVSSPRADRRCPGRSWYIRRVLEASPFHGEGYRKAWAAGPGMRTSGAPVDATTSKPRRATAWDVPTWRRPPCPRGQPSSSWPSITARPRASGSIRQPLRSRSARASGNASGARRCRAWRTLGGSRSSASKASCGSPKATASRSASSGHVEELRLALLEFRTSSRCWRSTTMRRDLLGLERRREANLKPLSKSQTATTITRSSPWLLAESRSLSRVGRPTGGSGSRQELASRRRRRRTTARSSCWVRTGATPTSWRRGPSSRSSAGTRSMRCRWRHRLSFEEASSSGHSRSSTGSGSNDDQRREDLKGKNWLTEVGLKNSSESTTIVIYRH